MNDDLDFALAQGGGGEASSLRLLADQLAQGRPAPSASTRSELQQTIAQANPRSRPPRLGLLIGAYAAAGTLALVGTALVVASGA